MLSDQLTRWCCIDRLNRHDLSGKWNHFRVHRDSGTIGKDGKLDHISGLPTADWSDTFPEIQTCPTLAAATLMRMADQILDKRFNSLAQPSITTTCLETAVSGASSLIIRNRWPSAVTS